MAVSEISERISSGRGPKNTGDFLVEVTARLVDRMSPVIEGLDESEDEIEDMVVTGEYENLRSVSSPLVMYQFVVEFLARVVSYSAPGVAGCDCTA